MFLMRPYMSVTLASGFVSMKEVKVEAGVVEVAS